VQLGGEQQLVRVEPFEHGDGGSDWPDRGPGIGSLFALGHLRLAETSDPEPGPGQALVRIHAISLNPGEVIYVVPGSEEGSVPGWDAAGVVVRAAADGTGPSEGSAVVTLGSNGAWAELRAVDTDLLGIVPDGVDHGAVSTLPVAATSALRALRRIGPILGRRVLVTGAGGAVGRFAVRLAALGGEVIAATSDPDLAKELRALGATQVISDGPRYATQPVHGVIDTVGGPYLVGAYALLAAGGVLVAVGHAAGQSETFTFGELFGDGGRHGRSLTTFFLLDGAPGIGADLTWLAARLADGDLAPQISWRGSWTRITEATDLLTGGGLRGKAVLDIDHER
jgi:NADPH2:quinone reductase